MTYDLKYQKRSPVEKEKKYINLGTRECITHPTIGVMCRVTDMRKVTCNIVAALELFVRIVARQNSVSVSEVHEIFLISFLLQVTTERLAGKE